MLCILMAAVVWCEPSAAKMPTAAEIAVADAALDTTLERALSRNIERPGSRKLTSCDATPSDATPGLTLTGDRVTSASILDEISGFARHATTQGGLGGQRLVVTDPADYDPKQAPIAGTLRAAVDGLRQAKTPGWIVFRPPSGKPMEIALRAPLRLPDNITLDGRCADVTLTGPSKIGLVYIFGSRNVLITGLSFRKSDYVAGQPDETVESCIRLNGKFDAVAILHNDLERCADGIIDSTISPKQPLPEGARVTIAYNFIRDHDKTMLFGTFGCVDSSVTFAQACEPPRAGLSGPSPSLYLTLQGNLFLKTGQRHPRLYGRTYGHLAHNAVIFQQQRHTDGQFGSGYGVFVSNGAQATIEHNVFAAYGANAHPAAVWTTSTPGAVLMTEDVAGAIRLTGNLTVGREIVGDNAPETVAEPIYRNAWQGPTWTGASFEDALSCIAARAGRGGATAWGPNCR